MALFRTEKPKQFTYVPRFYDERKEELKNRIEDIRREVEPEKSSEYVPNIKGRIRGRHDHLYGMEGKKQKSIYNRVVTIVFVAMIVIIAYYIIRILAVTG
jgi:(p)ppGpp synthase/HD superfamily hydrolase